MPRCIVDSQTCSAFVNQFKHDAKKHRELKSDLQSAIQEIAADYENACLASRISKRGKIDIETWKYCVRSTDLKRSAKNAFRVIGVFLDSQPLAAAEGRARVLYLVLWYWKGDREDYDRSEMDAAIKRLKSGLEAAQMEPPPTSV